MKQKEQVIVADVEPLVVGKKRPSVETQLGWYRLLFQARLLDEKARNYSKQSKGWGYHASHVGHDGIQLALGLAFRAGKDFLFPYYRDMLTSLAAGITPYEIFLNGLSKADDVAGGGRHMSNHFGKPSIGIQNVSSATGNHASQAVGTARGIKYYEADSIAFSSQGESSCSEGYVFEALNGAAREQVPVIFVVQNNGYGISVPVSEQTSNPVVSDNYTGITGLKIINCDGTNPFDSIAAMDEAVKHVKTTGGPVLVHAMCVRIYAHSNSDNDKKYRTEEELAAQWLRDPLPRLKNHLLEVEGVDPLKLLTLEEEAKELINAEQVRAEAAPNPDPATATQFVLPPELPVPAEGLHPKEGGKMISLLDGINSTMKSEFRRNPNTFLWGQDVASKEKGGVFNVDAGMLQEFGNKRVFNAPIAEDYISATANGLSRFRDDIRIIIEGAQFADYYWPAAEQLIDISHDYYRSNGQFCPNIVIRLASGGYIGGGLYHSQNIEAWLMNIPGVRVLVPSFPDDAVGMLRHAIRNQGITFFLEPKYLYNQPFAKAPDPGEDFEIPFGQARVRREGKDLSIIAYGTPVHWAIRAANQLAQEHGIEAEVLDLRSIVPLDMDAIVATVQKTGKVLIVHEDKVTGGVGGEVAARIVDKHFEYLDAPIFRVGTPDTPVPFSRILERAILPQVEDVFAKALELAKY
ncbi:MAG TPA: thiamine pyrophosphate-dependent enzyme [Blastocatellia bacterium]|nr:thiamine pyrophosphate-dependent enzyme [Blastocatellia bacterium]